MDPPFSRPNPFSSVLHVDGQLPCFWKFDLFHVFHLGVGRNYLGSALALLSQVEPAGNVDQRFELLTQKYREWCAQNQRTAHCRRITKEHLNWPTTTQYPTAGWHNGDLTTSLVLWIEARFQSEQWADEMLKLTGEAAVAINSFFRRLYSSGAWLSSTEALEIGELGLQFLRRYNRLAVLAHQQYKRLFVVMPKAHCLHHICLGMLEESRVGDSLSPLVHSVQQDEDFIGRSSRLSRHVSNKTCGQRFMERFLLAAYAKYVQSGYLVSADPGWNETSNGFPVPLPCVCHIMHHHDDQNDISIMISYDLNPWMFNRAQLSAWPSISWRRSTVSSTMFHAGAGAGKRKPRV